jgi:hypothetical protein
MKTHTSYKPSRGYSEGYLPKVNHWKMMWDNATSAYAESLAASKVKYFQQRHADMYDEAIIVVFKVGAKPFVVR